MSQLRFSQLRVTQLRVTHYHRVSLCAAAAAAAAPAACQCPVRGSSCHCLAVPPPPGPPLAADWPRRWPPADCAENPLRLPLTNLSPAQQSRDTVVTPAREPGGPGPRTSESESPHGVQRRRPRPTNRELPGRRHPLAAPRWPRAIWQPQAGLRLRRGDTGTVTGASES